MKIDVIDNGGQWTHREWRVLRNLGVESRILANTTESSVLNDSDGLVLSGGAPSISTELDKLGNIAQYIEKHDFPVLGICVGAQFIALHFDGEVGPGSTPEYGKKKIRFSDHGGIFKGIPDNINVWENHNDEVKKLPDTMVVCASSDTCGIQAFYHKRRPIFGVQFHPEVDNTEYGREMFLNFLEVCSHSASDGERVRSNVG